MKKLMIAAATVALTAGGIALPVAASASTSHPSAHHHKQSATTHSATKHSAKHHAKAKDVQRHPCDGLGIDIALGPQNICIPL
jgi:Ni/Co efflux regulator RcnB